MRKPFLTILLLIGILAACEKKEVDEPVISHFSADPTTLPKRDTVTFTIDAKGDFITFYNGKATIDISDKKMPYTHEVAKLRFLISGDADTIWSKLAVTNVYDSENIKSKEDSIKIILLDQ